MTGESWTEISRMLIAGGIVATFAMPLGLVTAVVVRRRQAALLPRWKPWRVPWGGFEVLLTFLIVVVFVPVTLVKFGGVDERFASLVAFFIQLGLLVAACLLFYPQWRPFRRDVAVFKSDTISADQPLPVSTGFARAMTLAVLAWALLTPLVLLIHWLVNWLFTQFDLALEQHPLTKLDGAGWESVLLLLQACLTAPIIEEVVFRGILLAWMVGARDRHAGGLAARGSGSPAARPLIVMAITVLYSGASGKAGPLIFAGILAAGLFALWVTLRHGRRHFRAVYASAAFFGLVHSGVWPSPIPLFFLGLGLGWLAVRTRGVIVPVMVHGLFNAVSAVYVLRGAA